MAEIQNLECPECGDKFTFDPNSNEEVVVPLNWTRKPQSKKNDKNEITVTAYLDCLNGHTKPYRVKKSY